MKAMRMGHFKGKIGNDEIRYADANFWPKRRKRNKNSEIRKFKMADGRYIENHFLAKTRLDCPIEMKFGVRIEAESRMDAALKITFFYN